MTTSGVWWCSKRTRWAGPALHPLVAPHKRTSRYRATEGGSVAEANRATLELEPLPGGAVSAPRRQFNKKRSGSWMCGNGRSVKTRHQKWSSETGGRHDASMAEFRTRRPRHICKPRGAARFLSDLHMCRVGDGLAGWAYRIRTGKSGRGLPDWICVTTSPEVGASPAAKTLRVRAALYGIAAPANSAGNISAAGGIILSPADADVTDCSSAPEIVRPEHSP